MSCAASIFLYNLRMGPRPSIIDETRSCEFGHLVVDGRKTLYTCDYIDINLEVIHLTKSQIELYKLTGDRSKLCTNELGDKELYDIHTITPSL